jgi:hypothetical protein
MKAIKRLDPKKPEDLISKINEIIDAINLLIKNGQGDVYIGKRPSAYNLNAISKRLKS